MGVNKERPVLVIMAAGMGSRYGGLKQIDPIDEYGNLIIDFSIYDALIAGFKKVIVIIKKEMEEDFRQIIGDRISKYIEIEYAYQDMNDLPDGFEVPEGRQKPWGTGQAVLSIQSLVNGPFAVINADDFYGRTAFETMYQELLSMSEQEPAKPQYVMIGYELYNTLTEHGHVARGVCNINKDGYLIDIQERIQIEKQGEEAFYTEDGGRTYTRLSSDTIVSMNMWGFTVDFIQELENRFGDFLKRELLNNPLKCEYFLPFVVDEMLKEKKVDVKVMNSGEKWYGVTYKADKEKVEEAIRALKEAEVYPQKLWETKYT